MQRWKSPKYVKEGIPEPPARFEGRIWAFGRPVPGSSLKSSTSSGFPLYCFMSCSWIVHSILELLTGRPSKPRLSKHFVWQSFSDPSQPSAC